MAGTQYLTGVPAGNCDCSCDDAPGAPLRPPAAGEVAQDMHSGAPRALALAVAAGLLLGPGRAGAAAEAGQHDAAPASAVAVLAFFVVALVIGVFTVHTLAFTRVPYTALLLVRGGGYSCRSVPCRDVAGGV